MGWVHQPRAPWGAQHECSSPHPSWVEGVVLHSFNLVNMVVPTDTDSSCELMSKPSMCWMSTGVPGISVVDYGFVWRGKGWLGRG